ncbi:R3H domain-containing nucleic acid-binding protein [Candidatus Chlorohelix sp.]|uniref:R3H domain-containing nucleic acid-binding protein n=1 Tax=Candidatus Chlorohelix sp. TaxID=3139201 RepID=UPI0030646579
MIEKTYIPEKEALLHEKAITDDLELLLVALPPHIRRPLEEQNQRRDDLLEVIMDLGRKPEARYIGEEHFLSEHEVSEEDLHYVVSHIGNFGNDNRAGIERTLHRISCIRNRAGKVVGLTIRIGRAVYGTIKIIQDFIESGQSILLVGKPGVGKTTLLRETARVLADEARKRVVIVDTSNEIGGDGDIPHPAIGRSRRMQVARPDLQHSVMIEAVENHMPEVIVIDEIGTELEAQAARTIAERGVQLIGTAHGVSLENLMLNPTLSDLIGGIQSVTLGDEEARRRGTQKSVLERKAPPTFDVMVEIRDRYKVAVHLNVADTVDAILRGQQYSTQVRYRNERGEIEIYEEESESETNQPERNTTLDFGMTNIFGYGSNLKHSAPERSDTPHRIPTQRGEPTLMQINVPHINSRNGKPEIVPVGNAKPMRIFPHGINKNRLEQAIKEMGIPADLVRAVEDADMLVTLKNNYRQKPLSIRQAESRGVPIHILKSNTLPHIKNHLAEMFGLSHSDEDKPRRETDNSPVMLDPVKRAMLETEEAISHVMGKGTPIELPPQNAFIRRLQHQMAERYNLLSTSKGREPLRRVRIYPQ